jgi:photosystem II stability/assembly factor-like uncharacterized protein
MDPSNSHRLILGTNRVYETTNQADSWHTISQPFTNGWTVNDVVDNVAIAAGDPNTVYASAGGHVFVTHDNGASWTETNPTVPRSDLRFRDIRVDPKDPATAYVVAANFNDVTGGGRVWMTSDAGVHWIDISSNLPDEPVWTVAILPGPSRDALFVGTDDGVYVSMDQGSSWSVEAQGLPRVQVHQLEVSTSLGILAAATYGRGMWQLRIPTFPGALDSVGGLVPLFQMDSLISTEQPVPLATQERVLGADLCQDSPVSTGSSAVGAHAPAIPAFAALDVWEMQQIGPDGLWP